MPLNRIGTAGERPASRRPVDIITPGAAAPLSLPLGTRVWTRDGILPVEYLVAGDRLVTRSGGYGRLARVEAMRAMLRMMRIPAHALAPQRPDRDVTLPARLPLLLRGEDTRVARATGCPTCPLNAEDLGLQMTTLIVLHLDRPDVIYASGLEILTEVIDA